MKTVKPDYYDEFKCLAGECKNPCCKAGWQIIIDNDTLNFYNSVGGKLGEKLKENIITNTQGEPMFNYIGSSCAFFSNDGLCEIQRSFYHDRLCFTCRMFPRYEYTFGGLREIGLELSCPTVAKIFNKKAEPISFIKSVTAELPEPNEIEPELFLYLKKCRGILLEIIQNRSENLTVRIQKLLDFNLKVSEETKNKTYKIPEISNSFSGVFRIKSHKDFLKSLEFLSCEWNGFLTALPEKMEPDFSKNETFYENLIVYFVFRYYLLSVYDGKVLGRIRFSIMSLVLISFLSKYKEIEKSAVLYSRETEHSEENINKLVEYFETNSLI